MIGNHWNIPEEGDNRSGRPKTNWLIETAFQAWEKHKLYKCTIKHIKQIRIENKAKEENKERRKTTRLHHQRKKKKYKQRNTITSAQAAENEKKKSKNAREDLRDMIEQSMSLTDTEKKDCIIKAFKPAELNGGNIDNIPNTILIQLLNVYHAEDEAADEAEADRRRNNAGEDSDEDKKNKETLYKTEAYKEFYYKNRNHVNRVLEAARSNIF